MVAREFVYYTFAEVGNSAVGRSSCRFWQEVTSQTGGLLFFITWKLFWRCILTSASSFRHNFCPTRTTRKAVPIIQTTPNNSLRLVSRVWVVTWAYNSWIETLGIHSFTIICGLCGQSNCWPMAEERFRKLPMKQVSAAQTVSTECLSKCWESHRNYSCWKQIRPRNFEIKNIYLCA